VTDWRGTYEWLAAQPSVPQQVLRDLYRAVTAFFDKANPAGCPRFKSRKAGYATVRWTGNGFAVSGTQLGVKDDRLHVAVAGGRVKNMSRRGKGRHKAGLNRAMADAGWAGSLSPRIPRLQSWEESKSSPDQPS
jgi:transposase